MTSALRTDASALLQPCALQTDASALRARLASTRNASGFPRRRKPLASWNWQSLAHRTGPTTNRMSKQQPDANLRQPAHRFANICCPFARAAALPVLRQRAKHQPLTSNCASKSWQCLLIRSHAWWSWQSLAQPARRGLELVQLPSCGDDRQSLLAMCVDVKSFRYEAQSAAASAVGLGACAWCIVRGHVRWQCLAHWRCHRLV